METIFETDTLQFARRRIDLVALGELCMLCQISPTYATNPLFGVVDQLVQHVETKTYAILYERAKKDDPISVPVAFVAWGFMSRTALMISRERYRSLRKEDLFSGPTPVLLMGSSPHGHKKELEDFFLRSMSKHKRVATINNEVRDAWENHHYKE